MKSVVPEVVSGNHNTQILYDAITSPCPWFLLLSQHSSYKKRFMFGRNVHMFLEPSPQVLTIVTIYVTFNHLCYANLAQILTVL